jgi:predicted permease
VRGKERTGNVGRYARFIDFKTYTSSFSRTAGYSARPLAVGTGENAREMFVGVVTPSFFSFFNAPPAIGRYFNESEDAWPEGSPVAVLSYAMWQSQYGGKNDVLGSKVQIGSVTYTVIGVGAKGFVGLWPERPPAAFIPMSSYAASQNITFSKGVVWWKTYSWGWMSMLATRKPGVSVEAANADLTQAHLRSHQSRIAEQPETTPAALMKPHSMAGSVIAERGPTASSVGKVATWVGGVSVMVLLIACANVANLLLARALRRRREIALRIALGISRTRLLSQLLIESLVLAMLGGMAGLLVAHFAGSILRASMFDTNESASGLRDPRTILFAFAAAIVVGLLTGLAPAMQTRRADLTNDLKAGMREGTYSKSRLRVGLLVAQAALSVVLLVGAGLFVRSLLKVESVRLGFDADPVLLVDLNMRGMKLDSAHMVELRERMLATAKATPGVENASFQLAVPFWSTRSLGLYVEGIDTVSRLGQFNMNAVSPEFFATFGTRILRGRGIIRDDTPGAPRAMVVSENMARKLWPGRDAVGQCIRISADTMPCTYVVGIAENIKDQSIGADSSFYYYLPAAQYRPQMGGLFVRTRGDAAHRKEAVRRVLQHEMPGASYVSITPISEIIGSQTRSWNLGATMFVAFGILALVLAAIGLYSVISYNVTQRIHEMGIRVALGAQSMDVIRLIVSGGLKVVVAGVAIGVVIALWAGKWVKPLLFETSPRDPFIFASVVACLVLVAIVASWVPARRASRVDANVALRTD